MFNVRYSMIIHALKFNAVGSVLIAERLDRIIERVASVKKLLHSFFSISNISRLSRLLGANQSTEQGTRYFVRNHG